MTASTRAASIAPAVLGYLYHNVGGFTVTLQDLRDALKGHPKADCAIFWFAFCWSSGKDSDLYKVLTTVPYDPQIGFDVTKDPECVTLLQMLETTFGPMIERPLQPVKLADVQENDILIAGKGFICLLDRWPCRVFKTRGTLGVACGSGVNGVGKPGQHFWHPLEADAEGYVKGFRR